MNREKIEYIFELTYEQSKRLYESILLNTFFKIPADPFKINSIKYTEYMASDMMENITREYSFLSHERMAYKFIAIYYTQNEINEIYKVNDKDGQFQSFFNLIKPFIREHKINTLIYE
jgi:hypothetical protein